MMMRAAGAGLVFVLLCGLPLASAQPFGGGRRGGGPRGGPGGDGNWSPLKVGDAFPAVEVYDDAGKPVNTKSLKGKYTVIVNGCLT